MRNKHTWGAGAATLSMLGLAVAAVLVPGSDSPHKPVSLSNGTAPETTAPVSTLPPTTTTEATTTTTAPPPPSTTTTAAPPRTTTTVRVSRGVPRSEVTTTTTEPAPEPPAEEATTTTVTDEGFRSYQASWYGPGLYGNKTACGHVYTENLQGVAHRSLPCGTMVTFRYNGVIKTVPVVDRGPYVGGRTWDLSAATCRSLNHCHTGAIEARY